MSQRFLVMAGGTGGHVFPALAVANTLRDRGHHVEWLGTAAGIEARVVPEANFQLNELKVKGFRGKSGLAKCLAPIYLLFSILMALVIVFKAKPHAVIGFGGYASAPGGIAAWLLRKPLIIHEQNAIAGTTNTLLARFAKVKLQAFPGALNGAVTVGNPVRQDILSTQTASLQQQPLKLLVVGGSLGARALNIIVPEAMGRLCAGTVEVMHQTGRDNQASVEAAYQKQHCSVQVIEFIDDMASAYAWADIVVCRAGAMTVSEISVLGKAAIFIPYPYAIDDHQTHNARFLVDKKAGLMISESDLTADSLSHALKQLIEQPDTLKQLQTNAKQCGQPNATAEVATLCEEIAHG